ncbi:MAG TPA: helix-turn-helix domain-containing protein [Caulobacteraceae bacterium]|nr:helix-turn-helix domain-containing protein [Caulobacteraceae bacterium]
MSILTEDIMRSFDTFTDLGGAGIGGVMSPKTGGLITLSPRVSAPGFTMDFDRNEEIYGQEEEADFVYKIVSGVVRTSRMLNDGRRQVVAFYYPGDVFGLEPGELHALSAEAVTDCRVALARRRSLERAADRDNGAARDLWALTARDLQSLGEHMLLLSRKGATERVAIFLLQLAERTETDRLELPMSRTDIADYLGLTIESVSRSMTQLEREGAIALPSARRVVVRNRDALDDYAC